MNQSSECECSPKIVYSILSVLLILIGALMCHSLSKSISLDEYTSLWYIDGSWLELLEKSFVIQGQAPLYYIFLKGWAYFFGDTIISCKLLSLTFSILTIICISFYGFLKRDKIYGAIVACFLLAQIPSFFIATMLRPYPMGGLFTVLFFLFHELYEQKNKKTYLLLYSLVALALPLIHPFFILATLPHCIFILWKNKQNVFRAFHTFVIIAQSVIAGASLICFGSRINLYRYIPGLDHPAIFYPTIAIVIAGLLLIFRENLSSSIFSQHLRYSVLAIFPPFVLFIGHQLTSSTIFLERYYSQMEFGIALLYAHFLTLFSQPIRNKVFLILVSITIVCGVPSLGESTIGPDADILLHPSKEIRDANRECALFSSAGFVEAQHMNFLTINSYADFVRYPLTKNGFQSNHPVVPIAVYTKLQEEYVQQIIKEVVKLDQCLMIIVAKFKVDNNRWSVDYISSKMEYYGYHTSVYDSSKYAVRIFRK